MTPATTKVNIYTDCIALQGLFGKPLGDIKNKRIRSMIEQMMCFNLVFHQIPGVKNVETDDPWVENWQ